ncbi:glutamate formimidoyltransferase [candidate division WOR-3 bacterium RBG_13_43_14]|uniref:Formimidoyltransferase-cyclodeaminase n=1 Tax=candidate division WOR-3 bacterium RBG_13_43_14 TaxID=1802590 RepID=A0A1F4UEL4_UNCW3|nr:MAG: glutamate formimidoyltransferase [candidate division WOR-3 bacterium RBG_13_43_14]
MEKLVECIPNFSEGRDPAKLDLIIAEITSAGVELLDKEMDADHNRAVVTFIGEPEAVLEAAFLGVKKAAELIDLNKHKGEHPRMGATDVVPFVPISNITTRECVELAKQLGKRIAEELKIPIYLYEDAATRPDRKNLANIRKGEFEGLRTEIETNPEKKPDFGEAKIHPTAGATVVGARFPLIAFNMNLNTPDVSIAQKIANAIRSQSGGYQFVKSLGFELKAENRAQISCNMTNYTKTPLGRVFETAKREAERYGTSIKESEIVGLVPEQALIDAAIYYMQLDRFNVNQILEYKLRGKGKQSIMDFLHELALSKPTPGGGSVAALQAALGSALLAMVTGITEHKNKDEELREIHGFLKLQAYEFYRFVEKDKNAFDQVILAFKLPDSNDEEKKDKDNAIQKAYKYAAQVPFDVCRKIILLYPYARTVANKGLKNAISDVGVALYSLRSGFLGARINVLINLNSIIDAEFNQTMRTELDSLKKQEESFYTEIENIFLTKL